MLKHGRKGSLQEEANQYHTRQRTMGDRLLEKWSRTDVGIGLKELYAENASKARRVAMAVENVERHLKQLNETIISQTFQTTPENVLKVVRVGSANSHRGDIFHEIPLTTTDDAVFFLDLTYENTVADKQQSATEKMYEKAYYTSGGTAGRKSQAGNNTTSNTVTTTNGYLLPYKVVVTIDGAYAAQDNGANALTPVDGSIISSGTVNYTTGEVVITTSTAITAAMTIVIYYEWDSERSANYALYPKVALAVRKQRFLASPQPLGYSYTTMTELLLGTTGLGDAESLLLAAVADEHSKYKDYKAIRIARNVALTNAINTFDANFAAAGEISYKSHAQKLLSVIRDIGGQIYDDIKRGEVNKIVAGQKLVNFMQFHNMWKSNEGANRTGVYLAGMLDNIEVYQCPADAGLVAANEAILTYKNPLVDLDIGLAFGTLTEISATLAYPQFYVDGNIASVEDYMVINKKFVRLLQVDNLPSYI